MNPALSLVGIASLPSERANSSASSNAASRGGDAAHDLDQLHDLRGVEVVQADEPLRAAGGRRLVDHRSDEVFVANTASALTISSTSFHISSFSARFSVIASITRSQSARSRVVGRPLDARAHRVGVLLDGLALLDGARELLLDLADPLRQSRVVDLAQHDLVAGLRGHLRDAVAHQSGSEHAHLLDLLRAIRPPPPFGLRFDRGAYYAPVTHAAESR